VVIGFIDESSPQTTSNTVRLWSFFKPEKIKNTKTYKVNSFGFYSINGFNVIDFKDNSKIEDFQEFLLKLRQRNGEKKITAILDNFSTHRSKRVINYANSLNIDLVFLPPYSPDLNPIEFIWKSIKRILSTSFIGSLEHMRYIVAKAFYDFSKSISFAKNWIIKFLNDKYKKLYV